MSDRAWNVKVGQRDTHLIVEALVRQSNFAEAHGDPVQVERCSKLSARFMREALKHGKTATAVESNGHGVR